VLDTWRAVRWQVVLSPAILAEIARYHGADLYLADEPTGPNNTLHRFVFTLEGMAA